MFKSKVTSALLLSLALVGCGPDSSESTSCSVEQMEDGVLIECPDGTSAFMANPEDGVNGEDGLEGIHGVNGRETTVVLEDEPAGENCEFGGKVVLVNDEVEEYLCNPRVIAECDVFYGDVTIRSSADLAAVVGCKEITGGLYLYDSASSTGTVGAIPTAVFAEALSSIVRIGGNLQINNTAQLQNLDFLSNLEEVSFSVHIMGNESLTDISALDGLVINERVGFDPSYGGVYITNNPQLDACQAADVASSVSSYPGAGYNVGGNLGTCD